MAAFLATATDPALASEMDNLLLRYGGLSNLLALDVAALAEGSRRSMRFLGELRGLILQLLRDETDRPPSLGDTTRVANYLKAAMAGLKTEQVRALYLDSRNCLVLEAVIATGTLDQVVMPVRDVIRRALEVGAAGIIIAHNHPSGDPEPSNADISATRAIARAAFELGIRVHDHMIVGRRGCVSLRARGLL